MWQAALVSLALASFNFMCHPIILVSPTRLIAAIFSVSTWIDLAGVLFALAPATAMHAGALLAEECSTTLHAGMQLLPTPLASLVRRVASRSQTLPDVAGLAGYWAAHAFSATLLLMRSLGSRASESVAAIPNGS